MRILENRVDRHMLKPSKCCIPSVIPDAERARVPCGSTNHGYKYGVIETFLYFSCS
jgi:hypothetical protein